jgi:hypothetical protein
VQGNVASIGEDMILFNVSLLLIPVAHTVHFYRDPTDKKIYFTATYPHTKVKWDPALNEFIRNDPLRSRGMLLIDRQSPKGGIFGLAR